MRICFDLDETLCSGKPYKDAIPIVENINLLKRLQSNGHIIIIYTARGMGRSASNQGLALKEIGLITFLQLEQWGIPYDEIYFGKPTADIYIDDKAINAINITYELIEQTLCQINQSIAN